MPRPGEGRDRGTNAALTLVLVAAVLVHLPTLGGYFLGDDFAFVGLYQRLSPKVFGGLFVADWSQGVWREPGRELRPLLAASYWLDFRLWGANALGFRVTNLAWLVLAVWGLHRLVRARERSRSSGSSAVAAVAAAVFAAHPTLPGAVDWIAGRSDLVAAAAVFWSLHWLALHVETGRAAPAALGVLAFTLGLFAKESVVVVVLLLPGLVALEVARGRIAVARWATALVPAGLVTLAWLAIRYSAFGPVGGPVEALRSGEVRWGYYAEQLLRLPHPAATGVALAAVVAVLTLAWRSGRGRRGPWLFWGALWPIATLAPAAAATYESPRHVILAVAGPAVVLARLVALSWERTPLARAAATLTLAVVVGTLGIASLRIVRLHAEMGRASHELRRLLAAAPSPPEAQTVIVSTPRGDDAVFWDLALPFAAGPPFLVRPVDVLSGPDLYCCPDWLAANGPAFGRLAASNSSPVYRISWNDRRRHFEVAVVASPFPPGTPLPATFDEGVEWMGRLASVQRGPGR